MADAVNKRHMIHMLVLSLSLAHAGWFSNLCARYLIAEDPYQFEQVSDAYLGRELERLRIRREWGLITEPELGVLSILEREEQKRLVIKDVLEQARASQTLSAE